MHTVLWKIAGVVGKRFLCLLSEVQFRRQHENDLEGHGFQCPVYGISSVPHRSRGTQGKLIETSPWGSCTPGPVALPGVRVVFLFDTISSRLKAVIVPVEVFVVTAYASQNATELDHWMALIVPVNDIHIVSVTSFKQFRCVPKLLLDH